MKHFIKYLLIIPILLMTSCWSSHFNDSTKETATISSDIFNESSEPRIQSKSNNADSSFYGVSSSLSSQSFSEQSSSIEESYSSSSHSSSDENYSSDPDVHLKYYFLTDFHINFEKDLISCQEILTDVVQKANDNDADFICIGGDFTSLYFETKEEWNTWIHRILSPLTSCNKPVFILSGNHDDNSNLHDGVYGGPFLVSNKDWNDCVLNQFINVDIVHDSDNDYSKYYHYDIYKNNTTYRIVCLDSSDRPESTTNRNHWGFSERQVEWLDEQVLADDGYKYVLLSHMPIDKEYNSDKLSNYPSCDEMLQVVKNHQNKNHNILINSFAHLHLRLLVLSDFGLPYSCSPTLFRGGDGEISVVGDYIFGWINNPNLGWEPVSKETIYYSYDYFVIKKTSVHRYAIGAGNDKTLYL